MNVLDWLAKNVALVSSLASLLMVLVWIFYTNLFYRDFRTRHHPRIMIHQAPDTMSDSMCFVINLGRQMVNIGGVFITSPDTGEVVEITDYRHFNAETHGGDEIVSILKQGPLGPGQFLQLGTFTDLLSRLDEATNFQDKSPEAARKIEVRIAVYHGSLKYPGGGRRSFSVAHSADVTKVLPDTYHTIQMTSRRQSKQVLAWFEGSSLTGST